MDEKKKKNFHFCTSFMVGLIRTNKLVRLRNYPHHLLVRTRNYPHQLYFMHTWATQPECQRLEGQSQGPESLQGEVWVLVLLVLSFLVPINSKFSILDTGAANTKAASLNFTPWTLLQQKVESKEEWASVLELEQGILDNMGQGALLILQSVHSARQWLSTRACLSLTCSSAPSLDLTCVWSS